MNKFKSDEIVFLLGAGASVDASIPHSSDMIERVEDLLEKNPDWKNYKPLYDYIKSSIFLGEGIQGNFDTSTFNIERLVNTLEELIKKEEHPLYPFIGSWSPKLIEVTDQKFKEIAELKDLIVDKLRSKWISKSNYSDANYYRGLLNFQREYEQSLHVFTLNYDLCVEKTCNDSAKIELGFDNDRKWNWRRFEETDEEEIDIYLYKLHGSTNWRRDKNNNLTYSDEPQNIESKNTAIIFGTSYKLQYIDPFLYFAYQFRRRTIDGAKLIVTIGYGFNDDHVNAIIAQSLESSSERKLLSVCPFKNKEKQELYIKEKLGLDTIDQFIVHDSTAKNFLKEDLSIDFLNNFFPQEKDMPF